MPAMTLLRLLALAVVLWVVVSFVQRLLRKRPAENRAMPPSADMVRCAHCGLHLPQAEAVARDGVYFCSKQHLEHHGPGCSSGRRLTNHSDGGGPFRSVRRPVLAAPPATSVHPCRGR